MIAVIEGIIIFIFTNENTYINAIVINNKNEVNNSNENLNANFFKFFMENWRIALNGLFIA